MECVRPCCLLEVASILSLLSAILLCPAVRRFPGEEDDEEVPNYEPTMPVDRREEGARRTSKGRQGRTQIAHVRDYQNQREREQNKHKRESSWNDNVSKM